MTVQRPLRALPRRAAIAILLATLLALGWSVQAMAPARPVPTAEQATAVMKQKEAEAAAAAAKPEG